MESAVHFGPPQCDCGGKGDGVDREPMSTSSTELRAFTLMETMVVVAIVSILAAILVPAAMRA
ncbi:MAG: type II secretion system protein [Methanoregulaceae archaeon]|nr:type II secretion system protein [Methanoregulaceae archaeon]